MLALKPSYNADVGVPLSFPVAPACRLGNGVKTRKFPVDCREIHIHTGFNQRSGYHPAGKARFQPQTNGFQNRLAVGRVHQGGQVEPSFLREKGINLLCRFAGIHDAQRLWFLT